MVKNIDLEAPKSPHPLFIAPAKIFLQVEVLEPSKQFRCFSFLLLVKKYRDKLCLGTFVITYAIFRIFTSLLAYASL